MEYITTYTGEDISPLEPDVSRINLNDIAHALSLLCRANGHFQRFYSVAQHCINCAYEAKARGLSTRLQLACLLHDGSEAYISDIARPVKKHLHEYLEIEERIQDLIYRKYLGSPLSEDEHSLVMQVDDDMLAREFDVLMGKTVFDYSPPLSSTPTFDTVDYIAVENMFIKLADSLINGIKSIAALGIDGCRFGWCVVRLDSLGNSSMLLIEKDHLPDIRTEISNTDIAIIDIPIGLTDSTEERIFDREARGKLGDRRSSVFPVPCRKAVYEAKSYEDASRINMEIRGKKISRQSWAILPKIREVDEFLHNNPDMNGFLFEGHPELCFYDLIGHPCIYSKKDIQGEKERVIALRAHMDISALLENHSYTSERVDRDDIIDAAVLAVTGIKSFL